MNIKFFPEQSIPPTVPPSTNQAEFFSIALPINAKDESYSRNLRKASDQLELSLGVSSTNASGPWRARELFDHSPWEKRRWRWFPKAGA